MKYSGWPEPGELAVGDVDDDRRLRRLRRPRRVRGQARPLSHQREVARLDQERPRPRPRGQTVVAKVLTSTSRRTRSISIKDVNEHQRKDKIQDWKNSQKGRQLMLIAASEDVDDDRYTAVANAPVCRVRLPIRRLSRRPRSAARRRSKRSTLTTTPRRDRHGRSRQCLGPVRRRDWLRRSESTAPTASMTKKAESGRKRRGPDGVDLEVGYAGSPEYRIMVRARPTTRRREDQLKPAAW